MKVTELIIENVMKVKAIHILPKGEVITVQGQNGAGKSSILNALVMGFKGKKEFPAEPIRRGSKKGSIKISIDGDDTVPAFTITQSITDKSSTLTIEPDKVLAGETPRSFLDKLIGKISFDPLAFINEEGKKQRRVLMELIGIDVDKMDREEKALFDERTVIGRDLKVAKARTEGLDYYKDVKETEEVKVSELSVKLTKAMNWNQNIKDRELANEKLKNTGVTTRGKIDGVKEQIQNLQTELEHLELLLANQKKEFVAERDAISELETIDISDINAEIQGIESTNAKIRANNTHKIESQALQAIQRKYESVDKHLEIYRANRLEIIQKANIPVPGLTFDEDGLLYNDIPLSQCSDGEKLMVSMGISMALNPTMRVVRIKDGSLLDKKNMAILGTMCKDKDFQLWIERVSDSDSYEKGGKVGILIEEGEGTGDEVIESKPTPEPTKPAAKSTGKSAPNPVTEPDW